MFVGGPPHAPAADVNMAGAAALLCRSRSWFQKNWRTYRHPHTGEPLPRPFIGGEPYSSPWWRREALERWKDGASSPVNSTQEQPQRSPANDAAPRPVIPGDRVAQLLAAAGGL